LSFASSLVVQKGGGVTGLSEVRKSQREGKNFLERGAKKLEKLPLLIGLLLKEERESREG